MQNYKTWLKEWFSNKGDLPEKIDGINYFTFGIIDSLGIIELILAIETQYSIKLDESCFEDRRFSTIDGLAEIIKERIEQGIVHA